MQAHIDRKADPPKRAKSAWLFAGFLAYVGVGFVYLVSGLMFVPGRWLAPLWGWAVEDLPFGLR